jgi:hypothetical protein
MRHLLLPLIALLIAFSFCDIALAKDDVEGSSVKKDAAQNSKPNMDKTREGKEVLEGKVLNIIDGDTLTVLVSKTKYQVRLLNIRQPEKSKSSDDKSKKALADKFLNKTVQVTSYGQNNRGQILGVVKLLNTDKTKSYWLTTSTQVRHNSSCRYYQKSKGKPCGPNDGKPCKICGG